MTVNNPRLVAIQDEGVAQGFAHTINFAGAGVTAAIAAGIATATIAGGGGGSLTVTAFTTNLPYGTSDIVVNIVDAAVTALSKILLMAGHYTDIDETDPADIYFAVVSAAAGSFNFRIQSKRNESVGGPYKFQYFLA